MNNTVYVVKWTEKFDSGILGVFSSRYFADQAIQDDELKYPYSEYNIDYFVEHYTLDEVLD